MPLRQRDARLDALRGLFLVIMAGVHVPTPISHWLQDPFGFNSAAEGFVFLSAFLAGRVYGGIYQRADWREMARKVWARARRIYLVHLALVLFAMWIAWQIAGRVPPLARHFHEFLLNPRAGFALAPLLLHQPPLFDILPLYVRMLSVTPWLFAASRRWGWKPVLWVSGSVWLAAQFHLQTHIVGDPAKLLPVRLGAFSFLAWQFLWVTGLALGESWLRGQTTSRERRLRPGLLALAIVLAGFICRHGLWPQAWFPPSLYLLMDKWTLGPLRLLNLSAWVVLLMAWNPSPRARVLTPLALLGRNSLAVFAFHLPFAIAATTSIEILALSTGQQTVLGMLLMAALFPWAAWYEYATRLPARRVSTTEPASAPAFAAPISA